MWKEKVSELKFKKGMKLGDITSIINDEFMPDETYDKVYNKIRWYLSSLKNVKINTKTEKPNITNTEKEELKPDGTLIKDKIIEICDGDILTPELLMEKHNIDPTRWKIVSYVNNFWHSQIKGGKRLVMYQSKVIVKPLAENEKILDYLDDYFDKKQFKYDKPLTEPLQYDINGETLEIDLPDLHSGLLSWRYETGEDYDLNIVKDRFFKCIYDIVERCKYRKFKKVILTTLGDLIHVDNDNQTTTKGTFQQVDGRLAKIVDATEDMLIDGITILATIAPVEVIYIPGNHDRVTGYMLIRSVKNAFRKDDNVTFDVQPNPHKFRLIGKCLVGWTHGDMPKKNNGGWITAKARAEFGQSKYCEVHSGHYHSQQVMELNTGVIIKYLPALCSSSYWEHKEGYDSLKTMVCFIWNDETGLRDTWFSNIV